ncbi:MAG: hypothetical protein EBU88_09130 [Acidobacteria bacterium]|nr:hypothetical protein [Acidobacteriota bacterium]
MGTEKQAASFIERWGDSDIPRFSDPEASLYHEFGLGRVSLLELFNPRVWMRGFSAAILNRFGFGKPIGDPLQMPGAFLVRNGKVIREYRHRTPADRPDYESLAAGEIS